MGSVGDDHASNLRTLGKSEARKKDDIERRRGELAAEAKVINVLDEKTEALIREREARYRGRSCAFLRFVIPGSGILRALLAFASNMYLCFACLPVR